MHDLYLCFHIRSLGKNSYNEYNDYNDHNGYNDCNNSDLDLDSEQFSDFSDYIITTVATETAI